jgi:tetratricopeptide (TPR) repeat protein
MKQILFFLLIITAGMQHGAAQDIYNKARAALSARDTAAAMTGFQDAIKAGQKTGDANFHLGAIAAARNKSDDAIRYLQAALKADDENVEALKIIGQTYLKKGDVPNALKHLRSAAKIAPKDPAVAAPLGLALLAADSVDASIVQLTRAKEFAPDNAALYAALGDAYMKQNVTVLGIVNYQEAIRLDPKNIEVHFKLAKAFEKDRKYNDAVKSYADVITIDSTFADAYFQMGRIFYLAKQYKNALAPLRRYIGLVPKSFDATQMYAQALVEAGGFDEAAKISLKALQLDSTAAATWRIYFTALVEIKDFANAESALRSLQKRGQLESGDYLRLGKLYYGIGREDDALSWYEKAIAADSTDCDPYFNMGSLYMKKQNYPRAAAMFEKKIACDPRSLSAYINAGITYMQPSNLNLTRTRELFLKSIELKGDFLQGRLWLARYYVQVDSFDLAEKQYIEVLNLIGTNVNNNKKEYGEAHSLLASLYMTKKQYERSLGSFQKAQSVGYENANMHLSWGQAILQTLDPKGDADENMKKNDDALRHFRRCVDMDPNNVQGHFWLGECLIRSRIPGEDDKNKKLKEEACSEWRKVLKLDPRNEAAEKQMKQYGC